MKSESVDQESNSDLTRRGDFARGLGLISLALSVSAPDTAGKRKASERAATRAGTGDARRREIAAHVDLGEEQDPLERMPRSGNGPLGRRGVAIPLAVRRADLPRDVPAHRAGQ